MTEYMQELIRLAPALREAGVLKLGCGDRWVELAPADAPAAVGEAAEAEAPEFGPPDRRLRAYDAPGETSKR